MRKTLLLVFILLFVFTSFAIVKYEDLEAKTIAVINGESINYDYFQSQAKTLEILRSINKLNNTFYKILVGSTEGNSVIQKYEKTKLDKLAGEILFIQFTEKIKGLDLKRNELYNSIKSQVESIFNSSKLSENDILLYLISKGFENKEQYIYNIYHDKLYQRAVSAIYQYLIDNVTVSENEIRDEYDKNKDKYFKPQAADIKLVLLNSSDDASLAYQKIIDGYYTFDDIYKNKISSNEATMMRVNIDNEQSDFLKTIRSSFPGAILKPMKYNNDSYALIKIEKKYPKTQMTFEEARPDIIKNLKDEKAKKLFDKLVSSDFQQFKNDSEVIINSKYFKGDETNGN
ncbi:peptidyl-prolyl cis-trans isomerase [Marinitoga aeolica]|uniref:peptidylprolyl isomerase n=1 Tax=Marinitoga aeolica TaxID=2809031 RepID=A0ABY8PPC5_9BACT|nr:peptidyl-prolyl cis-trans isomerase [Marinitoga aeolica]WGS64449.1 peptidyl-prolyl cis-trans isomerase [Marinitoga aeolica]